jgi:hypothetical protein
MRATANIHEHIVKSQPRHLKGVVAFRCPSTARDARLVSAARGAGEPGAHSGALGVGGEQQAGGWGCSAARAIPCRLPRASRKTRRTQWSRFYSDTARQVRNSAAWRSDIIWLRSCSCCGGELAWLPREELCSLEERRDAHINCARCREERNKQHNLLSSSFPSLSRLCTAASFTNLAAATPLVNLGKAGPLISAPTTDLPRTTPNLQHHTSCPVSSPTSAPSLYCHLAGIFVHLTLTPICPSRHKLQPPRPLSTPPNLHT